MRNGAKSVAMYRIIIPLLMLVGLKGIATSLSQSDMRREEVSAKYISPILLKAPERELPQTVVKNLGRQSLALKNLFLQYTKLQGDKTSGASHESIYLEGRRFYAEALRGGSKVAEAGFDGDIVYYGIITGRMPPALYTKFLVTDLSDPERYIQVVNLEYITSIGYYVPERVSEIGEFNSIESLVLHDLQHAISKKVEMQGENLKVTLQIVDPFLLACHSIDLERKKRELKLFPDELEKEMVALKRLQKMPLQRTVVYILDSNHGYAVAERDDWNADSKHLVHIQSEDWKYYESVDIWFPMRSSVSVYGVYAINREDVFSDRPLMSYEYSLVNVDFSRRNAAFSLDQTKLPLGSQIADRTVAEARLRADHHILYTVAANKDQLLESVSTIVPITRQHNRIYTVLIAISLLVGAFLMYRVFRYQKIASAAK